MSPDSDAVDRAETLHGNFARDKGLFEEFAVQSECLDAVVVAVRDIDDAVLGDGQPMHQVELGRCRFVSALARDAVVRRLAVSAPHALELSGIGVEHDHPAIDIAIGHEQFIGRRVVDRPGRVIEIGGVQAALALRRLADLHQEFAVGGEFQALIVVLAVLGVAAIAADPDIVVIVDGDAMFLGRPVELGALGIAHGKGAAPAADEFSVGREDRDRLRRLCLIFGLQRARTREHPGIVVCVNRNTGDVAEFHTGGLLGPALVDFELRKALARCG